MEFVREKSLLHKLIIVDGIGKCGKSLLLDLLTSFETVEKWEFKECLEFIGLAHHYKKITNDMAIAILRTEIDTALYNSMIGRNINTRLTDDTSIYKYHTPSKYLLRALSPGGSIVAEKVKDEKPVYLCWTHDLIGKSEMIFEAFGDRLVFFYLNRKPIDIIDEWNKENYSSRMGTDPTEMQYCIRYKDTVVPQIALGWEEEYLNCTAFERTVKLIFTFFKNNHAGLLQKQKCHNLHVFNFEDLITNPKSSVERLGNIISLPSSPSVLKNILQKANCPRVIHELVCQKKEKEIKDNIAKPYRDLLLDMYDMHSEIEKMASTVVMQG